MVTSAPNTIAQMEARGIEPYIATGREPHHYSWRTYFAEQPVPPPSDASPNPRGWPTNFRPTLAKPSYRLRKSTVEPVIGIIKRCWASVSSRCAAWPPPPANGVWCFGV